MLDILRDGHKLPGLSVLFDKYEGIFVILKTGPSRREFKKNGIETELELVFPLLHFLIRRTGIQKRFESPTRLVVGDNEFVAFQYFDSINLPGNLNTVKKYPASSGTKIIFQMQFFVLFSGNLNIQGFKIFLTTTQIIPLHILVKPFFFERSFERVEKSLFME